MARSATMNRQPHPMNSSLDDSRIYSTKKTTAVSSMLQSAVVGPKLATTATNDPLSDRSRRLARELEEFVNRGMQGILATERGDAGAPSVDSATELQIQIARMFRQVCQINKFSFCFLPNFSIFTILTFKKLAARKIFPGNRELLYLISEKNWMGLLLGWMNQYDRPKVQVEAMLSLTTITDLCQQQCYQPPPSGGMELSPFSTGLESVHNHFRRPGTGQNLTQKDKSKSGGKNMTGKSGSIAERVKNIMNQAKETSSMLATKIEEEKLFDKTALSDASPIVDSNAAPILKASVSHQTSSSSSSNDGYFKIFQRSESEETPRIPAKSVINNTLATPGTSIGNSTSLRTGPPGPPQPPQKLLSSLPNSLPSVGESQNDTPVLSPAILSALNSSFQNLPTSLPTGSISSPIPLAGNYTQPLSVTSNNLLVRHPEAIPSFISLMTSPDRDVCENAMWVVGNIAAGEGTGVPGSGVGGSNSSVIGDIGDKSPNVTVKDIVLAAGAMGSLLRCMERFQESLSLQRIGSWVISTLVETKMPPGKKNPPIVNENPRIEDIDLDQLLNTQRRLIELEDDDILSYTCWALSHLCDGPASNISAVVTSVNRSDAAGGLVPRLVDLLHHKNWRVTKPALRTIGNIVCAEYDEDIGTSADSGKPANMLTDFTEVILECDAVPRLKSLINHSNREIQKEACWTLSNIAAGTVDQIQAVIDSGAIRPLVKLVGMEDTDQEVRSEACWVVLNATSCGSDAQIGVLVSEGCVSVLGLLMEETNMVTMALEGLERVLQVEEAREGTWRENQKLQCIPVQDSRPPTPLVHPSLIEKALNKKNSVAVLKRAKKIWHDHFVECALCNMPYSKHRITDVKFCGECKCHVCSNCNCEIYHLSYQEELWATSENTKTTKQAKKSKNKKKKEKRKNRTKLQESKKTHGGKNIEALSRDKNSTDKSSVQSNADPQEQNTKSEKISGNKRVDSPARSICSDDDIEEDEKDTDKNQAPIDFSLYLQQTGSIIALARLMDALDEGGFTEDFDQKSLLRNQ